MRTPLVSVVIPTYGRPEMLREAVSSVLDQTYENLEIVVVDDASPTPIQPSLASRLTDDRIRVHRHETNRGANAARNTGIELSTGSIVTFLDDDDRWEPSKLARQVEAFGGPDPPGVVLVGQRFVDAEGRTTRIKHPDIGTNPTDALLAGDTAGTFSTVAVRAEVIEEAGPPDERFPTLQDREWLIRLSQHGTFASIRDPLVRRRRGEHDQIGDRFEERRDRTYQLMLQKHGETAAAYGRGGQFRAALARAVAGSALNAGAFGDARRFALRSIRSDPTAPRGYFYALASLGPFTYGPVRRLKHRVERAVAGHGR